jgi:hypothetical protein
MSKQKIGKKYLILLIALVVMIGVIFSLVMINGRNGEVKVNDGTYRIHNDKKGRQSNITISENGTKIQLFECDDFINEATEVRQKTVITIEKSRAEQEGRILTEDYENRIKESIDFQKHIGDQNIEFLLNEMVGDYYIIPVFEVDEMEGGWVFDYLPREKAIIVNGYKFILEK